MTIFVFQLITETRGTHKFQTLLMRSPIRFRSTFFRGRDLEQI